MRRPHTIRARLILAATGVVAVALAAMIALFNVQLARSLSGHADQIVQARATAELALLRPVRGDLVLGEAPDDAALDAPVWVFAGNRTLEAPRSGEQIAHVARSLARGPSRTLDVRATDTRLYSVPVVDRGRRLGTVVAGVSLAPYEQTKRTALIGSLALGLVLLLVVAFVARWLVGAALLRVAWMTRQAATWSERDISRRFALGEPRDELTRLGATLDGLLDRLAASLRREQRFSAELSHELRTPLARVIAETELALGRKRSPAAYRQSLELVRRNAVELARTVDALVSAARHEAGAVRGTADALSIAEQTVDALTDLANEQHVEVVTEPPAAPLRLGVEPDLAQRILQPVVENACRYGRSRVRIGLRRDGSRVRYLVDDDGSGVGANEGESVFEPGVRGSSGENGNGAGLGLALSRRLARSAAGDVHAEPSASGGRFVVTLPAG
jgi:two-component system, OmpR family, sensor kinase